MITRQAYNALWVNKLVERKMEGLNYIVFGLAVLISLFWVFVWFVHLLAIIYGKWKLHRKLPQFPEEPLPGVSILKPLAGTDPNLRENLETFFSMDYPKYELLFGIQDEDDPAIIIVESLVSKYPNIDAQLFIGPTNFCIHPKVNNMIAGYEASKYDLVMMTDSRIRMKSDTLLDMVAHMTETVGMVHQMPYVCAKKGFAAALEAVHFGTQQARMYLAANAVGVNCATGMSMLMRKSVLKAGGGFLAVGSHAAEDFYINRMILASGYQSKAASQPAWQNCGNTSVSSHQSRMERWTRLRIFMMPHTRVLEPLSECIPLGILAAYAAWVLLEPVNPVVFFLCHLLAWFVLDYILIRVVVQNGPFPFSNLEYVAAWLFREITSIYIIIKAQTSSIVIWRGKSFRIKTGGVTEEIDKEKTVAHY